MAIQFIDNQPLTWRTDWPTDSDCKTPYDRACTLYTTNDYLMAQWKQTPCGIGANKWCNPTFTNSNPELVTNGNFATATGWTFSNASHDAVNLRAQFTGAATGYVQRSITVTNGKYYQFAITLGGSTTGHINVSLNGGTAVTLTSPGTYSVNVLASNVNTNIKIEGINYNGWVDTVSVKLHILDTSACWDSVSNTPQRWQINNNGSITKIAGITDTLEGKISNFRTGAYYKISLTVSGMTAGQITVELVGVSLLDTITTNGVYTYYTTSATVNIINLDANNAFDGTLSNFSVYEYSNYFQLILKDTKNATQYDLSSELIYEQDRIMLNYQLGSIDPGCYELCIYDACGYDVNTEVIADPTFSQAIGGSAWPSSVATSGSIAITGGELVVTQSGIPLTAYVDANPTTWRTFNGNTTTIVDYSFTTDTVQYTGYTRIQIYDTATGNELTLVESPAAGTLYEGTVVWPFLIGNTSNIAIRIQSTGTNGTKIELTDFSFIVSAYIPGQMDEYCSNCIEVLDSDDCTLWVGGSNDADAFGFNFANNFQVGARVRAMIINPKYKGGNKRYTDADGKYTVTQANTGKIYTLFIDYTDEHTHDWLRVAVLSDTVRIGQFTNTNNYYTSTDGDYEPEWPDTLGNWPAAQARIDMQKQTDELYNNNAG